MGIAMGEEEAELTLKDVWDTDGKLMDELSKDGRVVPLSYQYDFGVRTEDSLLRILYTNTYHRTVGTTRSSLFPLEPTDHLM